MRRRKVGIKASGLNLLVLVMAAGICAAMLFAQAAMKLAFGERVEEVRKQAPADCLQVMITDPPSDQWLLDVKQMPGVRAVARSRFWPAGAAGMTTNYGHSDSRHPEIVSYPGLVYTAVDPGFFAARHLAVAYGRVPSPGDTQAGAVIGARAAEGMKWGLGSVATSPDIIGSYRVVGILQPVEGDGWDSPNNTIFVPFDRPAWETDPWPTTSPWYNSCWILWVSTESGKSEQVLSSLTAYFDTAAPDSYRISADSVNSIYRVVTDSLMGNYSVVTLVICAVAMVAFGALFLTRVVGRAKEIGILRALGMGGPAIVRQQVLEAFVFGAAGTALGWLAFFLASPRLGVSASVLSRSPEALIQTFALALLVGPAAVLAPAFTASRISPVSSIRDELRWGDRRRLLDMRQIAVLVAFSLAIGAANLAAGLGSATVGQLDGYLKAVGANDVEIASQGPTGGVDETMGLLETVRSTVGNDAAITATAWLQRSSYSENGTDWRDVTLAGAVGDVLKARGWNVSAGTGTLAPGEIIIGSQVARQLGDSALGTALRLNSSDATYRVVGILKPRSGGVPDRQFDRERAIIMSYEDLARVADVFNAKASITVRCADEQSQQTAFGALTSAGLTGFSISRPYGDLTELRRLKATFAAWVIAGSQAISLVVALAVGSIMWNRVWENRRNLAIQMAVGAEARSVAASVFTDIIGLSLAAVACGTVAGTALYGVVARVAALPTTGGLAGAATGMATGAGLSILIGAITYLRVIRTPVVAWLKGSE